MRDVDIPGDWCANISSKYEYSQIYNCKLPAERDSNLGIGANRFSISPLSLFNVEEGVPTVTQRPSPLFLNVASFDTSLKSMKRNCKRKVYSPF